VAEEAERLEFARGVVLDCDSGGGGGLKGRIITTSMISRFTALYFVRERRKG